MTKKDWLRALVVAIAPGLSLYVMKHFGWLGFAIFILIYIILLRYLSRKNKI